MILKILLIIGALLALLLIVAAFQPTDYRVERATTVAAPAATVFAEVNDLHRYQLWNPWGKFDLAAKYTHAGPPAGPGASLAWAGNAQIGEGRLTIEESRADELVRMRLDFIKPFASVASTTFEFKPAGSGTLVTWSMTGKKNLVSKAMGLFMSMDKMVGGQMEQGLATLESIAEESAAKR